ncbi:MAG: HRDC domain-containing protein [Proteobacteria bacterium]|nr:ribonuclease D [Desulfobulbaceae bacterium]MBU4151858.1 HRDC domain-containing protein [Pseudomonadota bacterium]MDP2107294.1 HRDC domain-containing protein [Desulfobulbaceae bacterium]
MIDIPMITTTQGVTELANRLQDEQIVACDLEADSLHRYQEKVCLIQFSIPNFSALVDPLAGPDLSPLASVMTNPAIRKVFHGADYDVRSLHRDFGLEIKNLFDTMIASQFLGKKDLGLAATLKKRFDVTLNKQSQKADWSRRPLSPEMLNYAAMDTRFLIDLHMQLEEELQKKGRLSWVIEECFFLEQVRVAARKNAPLFLRFKGASRLPPRTLAVLEELLHFRDEQARRMDRPPFKVVGNETLAELATKRPLTINTLVDIKGLSENITQRHGSGLLRAIAKGLAIPDTKLPQYPLSPRPERDLRKDSRLKRLKRWREIKASEMTLDPGILANNILLEALANLPDGAPVNEIIPRNWQRELFADEITRELA